MVCSICIKKLEGVHRFAMMAYRTQEKLRSQLYGNTDNINSIQNDEMHGIKDTQYATKKMDDKGLLHSILTKVCPIDYFIFLLIIFIIRFLYNKYLLLFYVIGYDRNFNKG